MSGHTHVDLHLDMVQILLMPPLGLRLGHHTALPDGGDFRQLASGLGDACPVFDGKLLRLACLIQRQ